jgi:hypothetical protein
MAVKKHSVETAPEDRMDDTTTPRVRAEAVARGRALIQQPNWFRADEVAGEMLSCLMDRRLS